MQTSQHDALLLAGQRLAIESGADEEALIVLGLPAGLYARQRDALRETSGIGTAATQAETIETLKRRSFIRVDKKAIRPTELGCQVIASIPQEMTDPGVTAAWEDALGMIAKGKYAPALFMKGIDVVVERWLGMIRASARDGRRITAEAQKPTSQSSASAKPARSASSKPARKGAR